MSARSARSANAAATSRQARAVSAVLATAIEAHQRGQFETARQGYTAVLEHEPENFDALHLLGVVAAQLGQPEVAVDLIGLALNVRPRSHEALGNLGMALKGLDRIDEAEAALRSALGIAPGFVDGLRNLAVLCQSRGGTEEAIALLTDAARRAPAHPGVRGNLGALLLARGDAQAAHVHLTAAARLASNDPDVAANLGRACLEIDRVEAGVAACERALRLDPDHVPALVTLSALERVQGRFDVAERHARRALQASPRHRGAHLNLATALVEMARYDEACAVFDRLLAADPRDVEAHTSRAAVALACGQLADAWPHHEWRWRLPSSIVPQPPAAPEWTGEMLGAGRLYLWPEQGLGDEVLFASLLPDVLERTPRVTLACDARLGTLLARSFPAAEVVDSAQLARMAAPDPLADRQIPLSSLGAILRPSLAAFPRRGGYLRPDPQRAEAWRAWLDALGPGLKVGISWRSQNQRGERRLACTSLPQWAEAFAVDGVHFVCLQYDECSAELADARRRQRAVVHVPPALDQRDDLEGVVALMHGLDLVVTVATAVSALAGAVGAPTWQLARGVDWHALGCAHSPWQPSVRQVYRRWNASWEEVLSGVASDLRVLASNRAAQTDRP